MTAPMEIRNVHERILPATADQVGTLLDGLAGPGDRLWPAGRWPGLPLRFDRPLGVGARGGHGSVRYTVEEYVPGRLVVFRFSERMGLDGTHRFEVDDREGVVELRHVLVGRPRGLRTLLSWLLVVRPLHDAVLEDLLDRAELAVSGRVLRPARWSWWVRLLRRRLARRLLEPRRAGGGSGSDRWTRSGSPTR
ncbi:MAG TPA: SRPBCC family protein [Actinomycetes bacterium]